MVMNRLLMIHSLMIEALAETVDFEGQYFQLLDRISDLLRKNNPSLQGKPHQKTNYWIVADKLLDLMQRVRLRSA